MSSRSPVGLWWGIWPGLGGMALLGSSVAVISATQHLPALGVQAARYAVAAATLTLLARPCGVQLRRPGGLDLLWVVAGALCGLVGFNLAVVVGTRHAEPGVFGAAVACVPVVLALAGPLARRQRPSARVVAGAIVVSCGAVAVTGWADADALGAVLAASLIAFEAGFTLLGAQAIPRMGAWGYSAATSAVAAVVFAALSAVVESPSVAEFAEPVAAGAIGYLGVVATGVAFVLWFTSVRRVGAAVAGLAAGIAAPAAAVIGAGLGGPLPSAGAWAGMVVIAAGLAVGLARPSLRLSPSLSVPLRPSPPNRWLGPFCGPKQQ